MTLRTINSNQVQQTASTLAAGETFVVNADAQVLFADPIVVTGDLQVIGQLIDVSPLSLAGGADTDVQFNTSGQLDGSPMFTRTQLSSVSQVLSLNGVTITTVDKTDPASGITITPEQTVSYPSEYPGSLVLLSSNYSGSGPTAGAVFTMAPGDFAGNGGGFYLNGGTANSSLSGATGGTFTFNGGSASGSGATVAGGTFTFNGGSASGSGATVAGGSFVVNGGMGNGNTGGSLLVSGGSVAGSGSIEMSAGSTGSAATSGEIALYTFGTAQRLAWTAYGELTINADPGTAGYVLTSGGATAPAAWAPASGGGGSPGGSNTQIQFNNSGVFGASSLFTYTEPGSGVDSVLTIADDASGNKNGQILIGHRSTGDYVGSLRSDGGSSAFFIEALHPTSYMTLTTADNPSGNSGNVNFRSGVGSTSSGNMFFEPGNDSLGGTPGVIIFKTNSVERLRIDGTGEWELASDPGTSGEVLTSQGTGSSPIWSAPAIQAPGYEAQVATALQTVFNTTVNTTAAASFKSYLQVFVNGVLSEEGGGLGYTVTGPNQITFTSGITLGVRVVIYSYS